MKHDFVKLAMAGLLAGFCVSATAASSATPEIAQKLEQEIAMSSCSKESRSEEDSFCNGQPDCSNSRKSKQCNEQSNAASEVQTTLDGAALQEVKVN